MRGFPYDAGRVFGGEVQRVDSGGLPKFSAALSCPSIQSIGVSEISN